MPEQMDARGKPRAKYQTVNDGPDMAVQADADKADITKILRRYREVGIVDHLNLTEASFPDVTAFTDYQDVIQTSRAAETEFMKLPSKVREIFNHDVAIWLDTAHDEEKRAALIAAGEIEPLEQPAPCNPPDSGTRDAEPGDPGS